MEYGTDFEVSQLGLKKKTAAQRLAESEAKLAALQVKLAAAKRLKEMREAQPGKPGTHPGIKARHFFEEGITKAAPQIYELFNNKVENELNKFRWLNPK